MKDQRQVGQHVHHLRKRGPGRSEEPTSELQSQFHLVCRLLLEKKKKQVYWRCHPGSPPRRDPLKAGSFIPSWRTGPWLYFNCSFFFNDTATTEIYTLSLHDALPI